MMSARIGALFAISIVLAAGFASGEELLFLNRQQVHPSLPPFRYDDDLYVPLPFARFLGLEVPHSDSVDDICVRYRESQPSLLDSNSLIIKAGCQFVPLRFLIGAARSTAYTIGSRTYISSKLSQLISLDVTPDSVTIHFDSPVPYEMLTITDQKLRLRFFHSYVADEIPTTLHVNDGYLQTVTTEPSSNHTVDVILKLVPSSTTYPHTESTVANNAYSVSVNLIARPTVAVLRQQAVFPWAQKYDIATDFGSGPVTGTYVQVEDWHNHYRLQSAVSTRGVGKLDDLDRIAAANAAPLAINANFYDTATGLPVGLLIVDGTVRSSNYSRRAALGIDILGNLTFFRPTLNHFVVTETGRFPISDVNRPIKQNELVAYTHDYTGSISGGHAVGCLVANIQSDRVTAIYQTDAPVPDTRATVLVATGTATKYLQRLHSQDKVKIVFRLDQGSVSITDSISAGPLLIGDGKDTYDLNVESFLPNSPLVSGQAARSVVATEASGSLIFLTIDKNQASAGATLIDLLRLLHSLPITVDNAIALDGGHASSLVIYDGFKYRQLSAGGKVAAALTLVPLP